MRTRSAVVVGALLGCLLHAASAQAVTNVDLVSLTGDFALPGSEIVLQTIVTANGGETSWFVQGQLLYNTTWVHGNSSASSQVNLSTVGAAVPGWLSGGLPCGTGSACTAFNQIHLEPNGATSPAPAGLTDFPLAMTHFIVDPATPPGTVLRFDWRTTPSTLALNWFGHTSAPGVVITALPGATIMVVPEPATAALIGVGAIGLALARRSRT